MSESKFSASPTDGKEILRILESSAAKGSIELLYTRRPDAYESYMKEWGEARVFVSRRGENAIGTCAEIVRTLYIDGKPCKAAYVCGLKKDAELAGNVGFGAEFIKGLYRDDIDFYYCSVVADNRDAVKMFERARHVISMKPFASYKTFILNPRVRISAPKHAYVFRRATYGDEANITRFLNNEGAKKDLFPVFEGAEGFYKLNYSDFYLLLDGERIIAAAALWNQIPYKQYVVKRYGRWMKAARLFNPLISLFGYIRLPKENAALDFPMLSFFTCKDDSVSTARIFLKEIKKEIIKNYGMFVIGLPKDHFAYSLFDSLPAISFETLLYEISFPWSNKKSKPVDKTRIHPECGLL